MENGAYALKYLKVDKLFASPVKEEQWLNKMAAEGLELVDRRLGGYCFAVSSNADLYYFTVAYTDVTSARHEMSEETKILTDKLSGGAQYILTYGTKVYYKTPKTVASDTVLCAAEKRKTMRNHFFASMVFLLTFLSLLCYNLSYWVMFKVENIGVTFSDGQLSDYIVKERSLWDYTIDLTKYFGEYPCTPHISLCLCLTVLAIPFAVFYLDQYLLSKSFEKAVKAEYFGKAGKAKCKNA